MSGSKSDTLRCRFKFMGMTDYTLDDDLNLTYVGSLKDCFVTLPYGLHGLKGTGFSGLDVEVIKFNKDLVEFEYTSLANCKKLRELQVYSHQLSLVICLLEIYPDLIIKVREVL